MAKKKRWWATRGQDVYVSFWHSVNEPRITYEGYGYYKATGCIGELAFPLSEPPLKGQCIEIRYPIQPVKKGKAKS